MGRKQYLPSHKMRVKEGERWREEEGGRESDLKDDWEYLDGCGGAEEEPRVRKCHRDRCPLVAHDLPSS